MTAKVAEMLTTPTSLSLLFYPLAVNISDLLLKSFVASGNAVVSERAWGATRLALLGVTKHLAERVVKGKTALTSVHSALVASDLLAWQIVIKNRYGPTMHPRSMYVVLLSFFVTQLTLTLQSRLVEWRTSKHHKKLACQLWAEAIVFVSVIVLGSNIFVSGTSSHHFGTVQYKLNTHGGVYTGLAMFFVAVRLTVDDKFEEMNLSTTAQNLNPLYEIPLAPRVLMKLAGLAPLATFSLHHLLTSIDIWDQSVHIDHWVTTVGAGITLAFGASVLSKDMTHLLHEAAADLFYPYRHESEREKEEREERKKREREREREKRERGTKNSI